MFRGSSAEGATPRCASRAGPLGPRRSLALRIHVLTDVAIKCRASGPVWLRSCRAGPPTANARNALTAETPEAVDLAPLFGIEAHCSFSFLLVSVPMKHIPVLLVLGFALSFCNLSNKLKPSSNSGGPGKTATSDTGGDAEKATPTAAQTQALAGGATAKWEDRKSVV